LKVIDTILNKLRQIIKDDKKKGEKGYYKQFILRFIFLIYHHLMNRNITKSASALSFDFMLALIPTFFLAFSLLNVFGVFENQVIIEYIQQNFMPVQSDNLQSLFDLLQSQNYGTIGSIGVVTLLFFSTSLFLKIEDVFNQIWKVTDKRPFSRRFTNFFTFIMLAPILISVSIHYSSMFKSMIADYTFISTLGAIFSYIMSGSFIIAMFMTFYLYLPNTKVMLKAAFLGAIFTTIAFIILKTAFNLYMTNIALKNYKNIFGTMSIIPVFFIWIYAIWVVTLIGAVISYVSQKYHGLWKNNKKYILGVENQDIEIVTTEKLLEIFFIIASRFQKGNGATTLGEISQYFKTNPEIIIMILDKWIEKGLLIKIEEQYNSYIPKKPLEFIKLIEITSPFMTEIDVISSNDNFEEFILKYRSMRFDYIKEKNISSLL